MKAKDQVTIHVHVWSGGLGLRSAVCVAPSAYLASTSSSAALVEEILPPPLKTTPAPFLDEAKTHWSAGHGCPPPEDAAARRQKSWDTPRMTSIAKRLLDDAENDEECARNLPCPPVSQAHG